MKIECTVQEKRDGDVLKNTKTAYVEIVGDKELVELIQRLWVETFKKYHGNEYTVG